MQTPGPAVNADAVGIIGLGNAGSAMVEPLSRHYSLFGYDLDPNRRQTAERHGVAVEGSAGDVVQRCDIIILSLPTPKASYDALSAVTNQLTPGKLVIETSTVAPADVLALSDLCASRGARMMDSAVLGGIAKVREGRTTFLVGAEREDFDRAAPVLNAMAEEVFYLGAVGNGMRTKLVVNGVSHALMVLIVEAAALARSADVPLDVLYRLLDRDSGLARPLRHRLGERIFNEEFEGGMSTNNARKDSLLILDEAHRQSVPLFVIQAAHTVYDIGVREGLGTLDYASIARLWERWVDTSFRTELSGEGLRVRRARSRPAEDT